MTTIISGSPCKICQNTQRYKSNRGCIFCARQPKLTITLTVLHEDDKLALANYAAALRKFRQGK